MDGNKFTYLDSADDFRSFWRSTWAGPFMKAIKTADADVFADLRTTLGVRVDERLNLSPTLAREQELGGVARHLKTWLMDALHGVLEPKTTAHRKFFLRLRAGDVTGRYTVASSYMDVLKCAVRHPGYAKPSILWRPPQLLPAAVSGAAAVAQTRDVPASGDDSGDGVQDRHEFASAAASSSSGGVAASEDDLVDVATPGQHGQGLLDLANAAAAVVAADGDGADAERDSSTLTPVCVVVPPGTPGAAGSKAAGQQPVPVSAAAVAAWTPSQTQTPKPTSTVTADFQWEDVCRVAAAGTAARDAFAAEQTLQAAEAASEASRTAAAARRRDGAELRAAESAAKAVTAAALCAAAEAEAAADLRAADEARAAVETQRLCCRAGRLDRGAREKRLRDGCQTAVDAFAALAAKIPRH